MAEEHMVPNPATLVQYANPIVSLPENKLHKVGTWTQKERLSSPGFPEETEIPGLVPGASIPCEDVSLTKIEVEDILNTILPPRVWEVDGEIWKQTVCSNPATRVDVLSLQEQLSLRLKQRQAREKGICPIRRELYSQSFDELIRQVTINCVERGLLLIRIRDEIRMTIAAHRSLYECSTCFGTKKDTLADVGKFSYNKPDLDIEITKVMSEKNELETTYQELKIKMEQIERKYNEHKEAGDKIHTEETQFLKRANLQLQAQLDGIMGTKPA